MSGEVKDKVDRVCEECIVETGIDRDTFMQLKQGIIEEGPILNKALHCWYHRMGYYDDNGDINFQALKNDEEELRIPAVTDLMARLHECEAKGLSGPTREETAFLITKCIILGH